VSAGAECHSDDCITCGDDGVIHPEHCITCGDTAMTMQVLKVDDGRGLALCIDGEGSKSSVEIELVAPVGPGDELLVHAGTALARLA
jgi:hydrogenase maturation factor